MNASIEEQLHRLRVIISADMGPAGRLLVTSATAQDEPDLLALCLAHGFAADGRRTALVRLGELPEANGRAKVSLSRQLDLVSLAPRGGPGPDSTPTFEVRLQELRASYEYCIVDGGVLAASATTLEAAHVVDGVIVAAALGRLAVAADAALVPALTRVNARFIGAVALDPAALRASADLLRSMWTRQYFYDGPASGSAETETTTAHRAALGTIASS